jgi:RNA polymerase sigma-70 factor (ECF subfamily)
MSTVAGATAPRDPWAREFEEIFSTHYDLVHGTAFGVTGRREDAEDVVQTVFLRLLRREMPPDVRKKPKAYLYRAAVNESLNIVRYRRRHPTTELEGWEVSVDRVESIPAEAIHQTLYEAITELKPKHAEILILRYVHEYSDGQIAELLGASRGTIAVTLHRTRRHLKRILRTTLGGVG